MCYVSGVANENWESETLLGNKVSVVLGPKQRIGDGS